MLTAGRTRQLALTLTALLAAATVTELVLLGTGLAGRSLSHTSTRLYDIVVVGAAVICALHTATRKSDRLAWSLMTLALAFWAGGELYYDIVLAPAASVPIPSVSDLFWLAFYPPAYAGLVLLARAEVPHLRGAVWLDGLIGALGVSSVFAAVVFDTVLRHTHGGAGVEITGLAYPVGDLALLAVFVSVGVASGRELLTRSWLLLGAGLTIFLVGDSIYLVQTANGTYVANTMLDATWPVALVLIGAGAWGARSSRSQPVRRPQNSIIAPIGLSTLALGVLIFDHFHRTNLLALGLAAACVLGVTIRLFVAFRDMRSAASANAFARDEAVEASNAKSMFVATVSHELRTPLNGVLGMTNLLLDTPLDEQQREYAEIVRSSGEGLLLIINDILDYSKMEAGKVELESENFALRETVAEGCAMLLAGARSKGVELEVVADSDLPAWLRGDAARIRQVVINLVSNAVKFTAEGSVTVRIGATTDSGLTLVRIEVADTGIGIDERSLDRLFEPFVQADNSTARRFGGTGLGLTISAQLVEMMGGSIGATSELGTGSTFWFEVPLEPAVTGALPVMTTRRAGPLGERDAAGALTESAPLVLVAEDSHVNQLLAVRLLDQCGYRAEIVSDGLEALEAIAQTNYSAILMDCQMPELDGYQATQEIRRREGVGEHVPIIAMTAHSMAGDRDKCIAAGMDDYVSKPIRLALLTETLTRWVPQDAQPDGPEAPDAYLSGSSEVLDRSVVEELRALDNETARELVELYFADSKAQIPELARAARVSDATAIAAQAHRLKGASLSVGAALVASMAGELEQRARDNDLDIAGQLVAMIEHELESARDALIAEFPTDAVM